MLTSTYSLVPQNLPTDFAMRIISLSGRNNNSKTGNSLNFVEFLNSFNLIILFVFFSILFFPNFHRAHNICTRYPNYRFSICGIGELPTDSDELLGKCSQMATFVRKDILQLLNNYDASDEGTVADGSDTEVVFPIEKFEYRLLFSNEFPYDQDVRTVEEKILDDVKYFINRHLYDDDPYFDYEKNICEFPIEHIFRFVHDSSDLNEMRTIIRKEFVINEKDCVEHKLPEESDFEFDDHDDDKDDHEVNKENTPPDLGDDDWD